MELIQLRLLGFPEFRLDGRRIELALRKAAALVIYLAEAGGLVEKPGVAGTVEGDGVGLDCRAQAERCRTG